MKNFKIDANIISFVSVMIVGKARRYEWLRTVLAGGLPRISEMYLSLSPPWNVLNVRLYEWLLLEVKWKTLVSMSNCASWFIWMKGSFHNRDVNFLTVF